MLDSLLLDSADWNGLNVIAAICYEQSLSIAGVGLTMAAIRCGVLGRKETRLALESLGCAPLTWGWAIGLEHDKC